MSRVSVIIPTYNRATTVGDAIESVLAQTYQDFEIIVVDDASSDNTAEVVSRYGDRVRYLRRETNGGAAAARNDGIRASVGEFISFLDADDRYLPERLAAAVAFLDGNPEFRAVYTDCEVRDGAGRIVAESMIEASGCWKRLATWRDVACHEPMHTNTITIRRTCFDEVGMFDERLRRGQDSELWLRLSYRFPVAQMRKVSAIFHCRETESSPSGLARRVIPVWHVVLEWLDSGPAADQRFARSRLARAYWLLALGLHWRSNPDAQTARQRAIAYCLEHRLLCYLVGGLMTWHFSPIVSPVWEAYRHLSRAGRRALGAIVR